MNGLTPHPGSARQSDGPTVVGSGRRLRNPLAKGRDQLIDGRKTSRTGTGAVDAAREFGELDRIAEGIDAVDEDGGRARERRSSGLGVRCDQPVLISMSGSPIAVAAV